MIEQEKSFSQVAKLGEISDADSKDKDKDKMSSNEIKFLCSISNYNKLGEFIKERQNKNMLTFNKKLQKKSFLSSNYSQPNNTFKSNKNSNTNRINNSNNNLNTSRKEMSLLNDNSHDDLLTIVNSSKKNLSNSFSHKQKKSAEKPVKNKQKEIDKFYFNKYKSNKSKNEQRTSCFSKEEKKQSKNFSFKSFENKFNTNKVKPLPKLEKKKRRDILDPKLQKVLAKPNHSIITTYLDRKKINDLPILYPLFLSYNNSYNSQSEKSRVNKILEKFVQLKTQIVNDYKNREKIIREFLLKNGVTDKIYFTPQKFANLIEYLKKPFKFDPQKVISDIIKEALNYKFDLIETDRNELLPVNIFNNFNITHRNQLFRHYKNNSVSDLKLKEKQLYQNPICLKFEEIKYDSAHLPQLVMELEENLEKIQNEGDEKINKLKGGINKLKKFIIKEKNKFVPNLCLKNDEFKSQYDLLIQRENAKLLSNYNRSQHIREINDRMYYNNFKKKFKEQGYNDEIKRKLKLTEYIIVQRAKKKIFLEQFNKFNKFNKFKSKSSENMMSKQN